MAPGGGMPAPAPAGTDPEACRGVLVKVGGYSACSTDLKREIQDQIVSRPESAEARGSSLGGLARP